jgi:hypothetical protein
LRRRYPGCVDDFNDPNRTTTCLKLGAHFFTSLQQAEALPALTHILPALADVLRINSQTDADGEVYDAFTRHAGFGNAYGFGDGLMQYLKQATGRLAQSAPEQLDLLTPTLESLPNDTAAFLLEHAWAANGVHFADKAGRYLAALPARLNMKYLHVSGGDNVAPVTRKLIEAIGPHLREKAYQGVHQ